MSVVEVLYVAFTVVVCAVCSIIGCAVAFSVICGFGWITENIFISLSMFEIVSVFNGEDIFMRYVLYGLVGMGYLLVFIASMMFSASIMRKVNALGLSMVKSEIKAG